MQKHKLILHNYENHNSAKAMKSYQAVEVRNFNTVHLPRNPRYVRAKRLESKTSSSKISKA